MNRKAFEAEARKHGLILDRLDKSGVYVQLITEQAWNIWQATVAAALATPATAPEAVAWINGHDLRLLGRQGRGALVWCDKEGNADTPLYLHPPATAPDELERKPSAKEVAWDRVRRSLVVRNAQITIGEVADTMDWQLNAAMKGTP